jgi:hypothetical protein
MRVEFAHAGCARFVPLLFILCIVLCGGPVLVGQKAGSAVPAQAHDAPAPHPALVFFAQRRLPEPAWAALFAALRASLPEAAAEIPALDANVELIRGDGLVHGALVPQSITIYLHGDCNVSPLPEPFPAGEELGWVLKVGPRIEPVIHVECTSIGQVISERTEWLSRDRRTAAMSEALVRVILHEWAHIATQNSAHGAEGITKAQFGADDLVQDRREAEICPRGPR